MGARAGEAGAASATCAVRADRVAAALDARGLSTGSRVGAGASTAEDSSASGATGAAASGTSSTSTAAEAVSGTGVGVTV
jgi:hypothetical protein